MQTIREALQKKTRAQLTDIGFRLLVTPPKKGNSKQAWLEAVADFLETKDWSELDICFSVDGLRAFTRYLRQTGDLLSDDPILISNKALIHEPELIDLMDELKEMSLAARDRSGSWWVQPRVRELLHPSEDRVRFLDAMDGLYDMLEGSLLYYGLIPCARLEAQLGFAPDDMVNEMITCWRSRWGFAGVFFLNNEPWFRLPHLEDTEYVLKAREEKEYAGLDYAPLTQQEALEAGCRLYAGRNGDYRWIRSFLRKKGELEDEEELDALLADVIERVQNNDSDAAVEALSTSLKRMPTRGEVEKIGGFVAAIPRWELKGHPYSKLVKIPDTAVPSAPKPKRDDPCPCGSGKKYKECCGNFH